MAATEQLTVDRDVPRSRQTAEERADAERAARESLRAQVAKLEGELSGIVARGFPHISPAGVSSSAIGGSIAYTRSGVAVCRGPRLLSLAELERERDRLVMCLSRAQARARERAELELRSRDLLERMRLEPGRYRFVRLRVADLGERGCGVWQVRPRLGLIGMLAGWWQLKLSSGCPLPGPRAHRARRLSMRGSAIPRAVGACVHLPSDTGHARSRCAGYVRSRCAGYVRSPGARQYTSSPRRRALPDRRGPKPCAEGLLTDRGRGWRPARGTPWRASVFDGR
jgi:hypothetical protein